MSFTIVLLHEVANVGDFLHEHIFAAIASEAHKIQFNDAGNAGLHGAQQLLVELILLVVGGFGINFGCAGHV